MEIALIWRLFICALKICIFYSNSWITGPNVASSLAQYTPFCQISSKPVKNCDLQVVHNVDMDTQPASQRTDVAKSTQKTILSRSVYILVDLSQLVLGVTIFAQTYNILFTIYDEGIKTLLISNYYPPEISVLLFFFWNFL